MAGRPLSGRGSAEAKASLLWGLVGGLAFLALVQGYELIASPGIDIRVKLGVAVGVGVGATLLTYVARGRLPVENESP